MPLTRPLIAFAFLAERFEETGDIAQGLMPLFAPLIQEHDGQQFSASSFAESVSEYYGIRVHPWAVEDWLQRLEKEGYVEKKPLTGTLYSYRYTKPVQQIEHIDEGDVEQLLSAFVTYATEKLQTHNISIPRDTLEKGLFDRLVEMEFLSILLKPDALRAPPAYSEKTLRLPGARENSEVREKRDREAQLDYICADFILTAFRSNPDLFNLLLQITCGALVAEVILDFQAPAGGADLKSVTVYLDAPFVMDLLDLSYPENVTYSQELFKQLRETGARIAVFPHSIDEIRGAIKAPLDRFERGEAVSGPTGSRLRSSAFRAYARSVVGSVEMEVKALGISIAGTTSMKSAQSLQYFTETEEQALSEKIGYYENVAARERDATSIANVIRLRQRGDIPMQKFSACRALFLTRNIRLADRSRAYLVQTGVTGERSVPPCMGDRYMAALLWISYGGKGKELSRKRLLANCASAITPRPDVLKRMHAFLSELDEVKAQHFQALMTNQKAAHYLMSRTLGDAALLTKDKIGEIYEEVEKLAGEKVAKEKDEEIRRLQSSYSQAIRDREEEARREKERLELELAEQTAIADAGVRQAKEEAFAAREEVLITQVEARREKRRADELARRVEELTDQKERTNLLAVQNAVGFARGVQRRGYLEVGAYIVGATVLVALVAKFLPLAFGPNTLGSELTAVVAILVASVMSGLQFWVFPEHLFGAYVQRKRDNALFRRAKEHQVAEILEEYEIDWATGSVRRKVGR